MDDCEEDYDRNEIEILGLKILRRHRNIYFKMISCNEKKFIFQLCRDKKGIFYATGWGGILAIKNTNNIDLFIDNGPKLLIHRGSCYILDSYNILDYFDNSVIEILDQTSSFEDSRSCEMVVTLKKMCKFRCEIISTIVDFTNSWEKDNLLEYSDLPIGYILNIKDDSYRTNEPNIVPENSHSATIHLFEAKSNKDFQDNFFSKHVRQLSENFFGNLGLEKDSDGYYRLFDEFLCADSASIQYLISQLIRRKNKDLIEKVCKVASEDPLREKTDLSLILYSEPDKECLEIAEKYGYYKPEEIDHLEIAGNYISYSEARAVFKYGTQELKSKLLKFLFGSKKILMSCNVNALYDVMIEKYPELEQERNFFHNKSNDAHLLIPREVLETTLLYKRLNL